MAVKIISGIPGSGKTLYSVYIAKQHFKKENSKFVKYLRKFNVILQNFKIYLFNLVRKLFHKELEHYKIDIYKKYIYDFDGKVNNIYSNFPIHLYTYFDTNTKKFIKVYSNSVSLWDLDNSYSFLPYSLIIIDEVQLYIDSDEFQDKKSRERFRPIAKFLQAHRHYGIKDIIFVSQHPNRVMAKIRNVTNEFFKVKSFKKILFLPIGFMYGINYFECDSYGKSIRVDKKYANYDWKTKLVITNIKKLYKSYDTCYLRLLNEKPLHLGQYSDKYLSLSDYEKVFGDVI